MEIIGKLFKMGANISFNDPYFNRFPITRKLDLDISYADLNPTVLNEADLVLLATDHDEFDYDLILKESKIIIDTRGRYKFSIKKVVKA